MLATLQQGRRGDKRHTMPVTREQYLLRRRLQTLVGRQQNCRHLAFSPRSFKISAAATAPAELAKGPSASVAVQTVLHHPPSTAVEVQVGSLTAFSATWLAAAVW